MKPSDTIKMAGYKSLREFCKINNYCEQTLLNWARNKPELFKAAVDRNKK